MIFTGGVFYHLRALRFKKDFWMGHQSGTSRFLEDWKPSGRHLILIGPSAGYSLPPGWLERFETVTAFEPDPVARFLFERRHRIGVRWIRRRFPFETFTALDAFPREGTAVLFCNILGQIEIPDPRAFQKRMRKALAGRDWASFHDALSGAEIEFDLEDARPGRATLADMERWIYVKNRRSGEIGVNAHAAPAVFSGWDGLSFRYWQWRILPGFTHLIEGVFKPSGSPDGQSLIQDH